jgi:hypothetical protein
MKNRPSSHFLLLILLFALNALAYFIIYRAGVARGYSPSLLLALRDLALHDRRMGSAEASLRG